MKKKRREPKRAKFDFDESLLPHNRPQVFGTVFKNRFGFITKISLLTCLFFIPLFACMIIMRIGLRECFAQVADDLSNKREVYRNAFGIVNFKCLIELPLFMVAGLGLGGAFHSFTRLVTGEIVFASDFFDALKYKNWLKYLGFGLILGLSFWFFSFIFYGLPALELSGFPAMICYGISIVQFMILSTFVSYLYMQNEIYQIRFNNLVSNSFKFTIKTLFPSFGFIAICFVPYLLILAENFLMDICVIFVLIIFMPMGLIALLLFILHSFDKYINKDLYPDFVDKGIKRL